MSASETRAETALAVFAIAASVLFLFEGVKLKPGVFEPIGPGAVPMGVALLTIVLSVLVLLARLRRHRAAQAPPDDAGGAAVAPIENWRLMLAVSALTLVYAGVLSAGIVRYGWATVVYLLASFLIVSERVRQALPWSLALALGFGLGLDYIFRHLLVADLP